MHNYKSLTYSISALIIVCSLSLIGWNCARLLTRRSLCSVIIPFSATNALQGIYPSQRQPACKGEAACKILLSQRFQEHPMRVSQFFSPPSRKPRPKPSWSATN